MNYGRIALVVIHYWWLIVGTADDETWRMTVLDAVACAAVRSL